MSTGGTPVRFRKKRLTAFRGRGELYSWLRAHSERVAAGLSSGELTWPLVCAECSRHGVVSRDGSPPTRKAAAKAWLTLCRDLEAIGESPAQRRRPAKPPSKMPKDWRPQVVGNAGTVTAVPALRTLPAPPAPVRPERDAPDTMPLSMYASPDDSPEVKAQLLKVEAQLREHDWYLGGNAPSRRRKD